MKTSFKKIGLPIIFIFTFLMHLPHFSKDLLNFHVWRQTQTQSNINNFYEEDMNIFNPRRNERGDGDGLFRMEFPLMQWLVAASYNIFGNDILITRAAMFVIGLFSILGMYFLLFNLFQIELLALIGAWAFTFSPSFFYYTINPIPDNLALCFSIWGLAYCFKKTDKGLNYIKSGLLISLGALCKLPFILYFIVPFTILCFGTIKNQLLKSKKIGLLTGLSLSIFPLSWYAWVIPQWPGNPIVKGVFESEESFSTVLYYMQSIFVSTLPELLLNYASVPLFISGFYFFFKKKAYRNYQSISIFALSIAVLFYYFFEAGAINTYHDYYLFPFFPLLFILVSYGATNLIQNGNRWSKYFSLLCLILLPLTCYLRTQNRWNFEKPGFNKDLLIYKNEIRAATPKDALVVAGNDDSHFIFFYYIDRKGWGYHRDKLLPLHLEDMIKRGAKYLYTDSKIISNNRELSRFFGKLVLERGSIRIYELKMD